MKNKKILIIIGGGISAYKSLDLIRLLKKENFDIKTVLTKSGKKFVTPLSLTSLTKNKPYENIFDLKNEAEIDHITLSRWADLILVVPATANFMSKLSYGRAEDLASTLILASNKDIFLVPAMNVRMWLHPATQKNFQTLSGYGYQFIGPISGKMACGEYGEGKMSSPKKIFLEIKRYFVNKNIFKNNKLKALVTTGPTREYIDPVRYISNESSGKQGYEIAKVLSRIGVKTTLITGPSSLSKINGVKTINVITAKDMFEAVKKTLPVDIAICVAAVADFKINEPSKSKIKKDKFRSFKISKNIDILEHLSKSNRYRPKIVVGFAAETEDLLKNSLNKIKKKQCDILIGNNVSNKNSGFNKDYNKVIIIDKCGKIEKIKKSNKSFIAIQVVNNVLKKFKTNGKYN